jgi:hypothetical protein
MLSALAVPPTARRNKRSGLLRSSPDRLPTAEPRGRDAVTQVQEQDEAQEETTPAVSPETVIEEEAEEEAAHERETAGDDAAEGRASGPQNEREVKALGKKIDAERERHAKKLGDLLGDAAPDALPCPLCFEGLQGFVLPGDAASLSEAQKAAALTFLGQEIGSEVPQTPETETCSRCDGYGVTKNPTRSPHHETSMCGPCGGQGYVKLSTPMLPVTEFPPDVFTPASSGNGIVAPCPLCGAVNSAGRPHFCNPQPQ